MAEILPGNYANEDSYYSLSMYLLLWGIKFQSFWVLLYKIPIHRVILINS